jgi:hypothetical protein
MITSSELNEYMDEIRRHVCSRCIERVPGGPPCAPLGKRCGIELHLEQLVNAVHAVHNQAIDPYIDSFHDQVCANCANRVTNQCPCPLEPLILLAVEAIETVDERRRDTHDGCSIGSRMKTQVGDEVILGRAVCSI